jgi:hypothetical protein
MLEAICAGSLIGIVRQNKMVGYSGTPLWKKLGYRAGLVAHVESTPSGYVDSLALPSDVVPKWTNRLSQRIGLVHLFVTKFSTLESRLKTLRKGIAPECMVWVSWPKKASGMATDVTEDRVRDAALPLGFVDVKVCAFDEIWSGLKLVIRKELR